MRELPLTIGKIHFIGIGGIGMSGIAEILVNLGYQVQGSDISLNPNVERLREIGVSINIPTMPSHFKAAKLQNKINDKRMDIRNLELLKKTFKKHQPDYVFHLAAQALVKKSYFDPIYTWKTNTIGTLNVLESLREIRKKFDIS